jgi:hypothetical protein
MLRILKAVDHEGHSIAIFCTLSSIFDVPVYWPILVMYFFVLFFLTMRRQIQSVPTQPVLL